jgi:hypothetical protein
LVDKSTNQDGEPHTLPILIDYASMRDLAASKAF